MSSFKTKTIALIASSLIVAVAGLSFATTPAEAETAKAPVKKTEQKAPKEKHGNIYFGGSKPAANKKK